MTKTIPIDDVRIDGNTQTRAAIDEATVADYAARLEAGDTFPAIVLFDDGAAKWLGDGFHRYHGHRRAGRTEIAAEVRKGTQRDAVLFAVGTNADHGLPRTNADKRRAVETLLADAEWAKWSDREIAKRCHVSHTFVAKEREAADAATGNVASEKRSFTSKHGTASTMDTAKIGRKAQTSVPPAAVEPFAPIVKVNVDPVPAVELPTPIIEAKPEPARELTIADHRARHNAAIEAAIADLKRHDKLISDAMDVKTTKGERKVMNPASAGLVSWMGTVRVLRDAAQALEGNLIVEHPQTPGEFITATTAGRLARAAK